MSCLTGSIIRLYQQAPQTGFSGQSANRRAQPALTTLMNVNEMALSEDKKTLILCGSEYQDIRQPFSVILKVNLDTKETEPLLADNQYNVSHIALSKDCLIFTGTDLKTWVQNEMINSLPVICILKN